MRRYLQIPLLIVVSGLLWACWSGSSEESPSSEEYFQKGEQKAEAHDWKQARHYYQKAVKADSQHIQAWINLGTAQLNTGQYQKALESYERAGTLGANQPYLYCSKASVYQELQNPEAALREAERALRVDSTYAPGMANKAKALVRLGDTVKARKLFRKAFQRDSTLRQYFSMPLKKEE